MRNVIRQVLQCPGVHAGWRRDKLKAKEVNMRSQIRGVVLEGLSCAGKTSTLTALKKAQTEGKEAERSLIVLAEHYSQVLNNVKGNLVRHERNEHLRLLDERVDMLERLNDWAAYLGDWSRSSRGIFFILERFHLNHRQAFIENDTREIEQIEERLFNLNAKTILLTISPNAVEERLRHREGSTWGKYSESEIETKCLEFLNVQSNLIEQSKLSHVETIEINTDKRQWDEYARFILELMD
jgi:thymidylate kinase